MAITKVTMQTPGTVVRNEVYAWLDAKLAEQIIPLPDTGPGEALWSAAELMDHLQAKFPTIVGPDAPFVTYNNIFYGDINTAVLTIQDFVMEWCTNNSFVYSTM